MAEDLRDLSRAERRIVGRARLRHGPVMAAGKQMLDDNGAIAAPYVALSTLMVMEKNGTITAAQRAAGDSFHEAFRRASLDGLKAAPLDRVPMSANAGGSTGYVNGNQRSKEAIELAIRALGGEGSIAASCAWHVLGLEWSLREWTQKARLGNPVVARGVLVATLAVLEAQFSA